MKARLLIGLVLGALIAVPAATSAQQPGEIFGKVTDTSGAIMPGVTVTLTSPVLLQPQTATTSETGSYRFPQLAIGMYTVKFELPGFRTVIHEGIRIEIGFTAQINAQLEVSSVQESVTVTGESPVVDTRDTSRTSRFNQEQLQAIPSARDPWVILEQSAGVAMDRQNVGGNASGQQSNFVARGAAMREQKWNLDGVDITDMSATGGSPVYFDFDAFEEMQFTLGGADVTMQSPGVGVNLVTKSGSDQFRGSGRFYVTDDSFQSVNVTDDLRLQGASTGSPIQNIKDFGFEVGGPLVRGRAWIWGSYGKQDVKIGVNGFYKDDASCQAMKAALIADPLAVAVKDTWPCLNPDSTLLNNYNAKFNLRTFQNNQASMFFNAAEKVRNARDASDFRPLETTYRQVGVSPDTGLGSRWWKTGMPKSYKWSDRHIFSDKFLVEGSYAHVGNNFALTFHEEALRDVQAAYDITSEKWARSYQEAVYVRPTDSVDLVATYFIPGWLGGDHSLKTGFKYRNDIAHTESMWGGDAYARFTDGGDSVVDGNPREAQLYRRGLTEYGLHNRSFYLQDSYIVKRLTINAGFRYDYQTDYANPADVSASPFFGQATFSGVYNDGGYYNHRYDGTYTGASFNQLPGLSFPGADAGVAFKNWSPRVGFSYDLLGDGRNVAKVNYARYVGQLGTGNMASIYNTVAATLVRYPWVDLNNDTFVQANEVVLTTARGFGPLSWTSGYDYNNPSQATTTGKVDPNLEVDKTDEIVVSFDRQIGRDFAVGASYIWRKYTGFRNNDIDNFEASDWRAVSFTPAASACPAGASCPTVTYFEPTSRIPTGYTYKNIPGFWRGYQGFELTARKRFSNRWQVNGSYSYNDAPMHFDSPEAYSWWTTSGNSDPTNIESTLNHGQYAPESTSSGLGNVFINAKWIFRLSGSYTLPLYSINLAAFYNARGGYPYIRDVLSPARPGGASTVAVFLDKRGDERLPNFQTVDFRIDKPFTVFGRMKVIAGVDVFNVTNGNTTLSMRGRQNAKTANTISQLTAPRVVRFGIRTTW